MRSVPFLMTAVLLSGCNPPATVLPNEAGPTAAKDDPATTDWSRQDSAGDAVLVLAGGDGAPLIRIACAARNPRLIVSVPGFKPIGSEDRLSFGGDGEVVALVAQVGGADRQSGVTAEGPIPDELKRFITGPIHASYGAQTSGPHDPPPDSLAGPFLRSCSEFQTADRIAESRPTPGTSPCLVQDGTMLRLPAMKAIGTEPFWGARTEGRCVTYSTPEDQQGTRIWTKVESGPMGPIYVGAHQGKPFVLRLQPAVNCSDGMSDRKYDWSADLTVGGEERRGCAERL